MIEAELELIKNKIKDDSFDLHDCEKKLLKIEKKLILLENKYNKLNDFNKNNKSDSESDSDSEVCDDKIESVIIDLDKLNNELVNLNSNIPLEKLIDNYLIFKQKLLSLKTKNEEFKLKIDYL